MALVVLALACVFAAPSAAGRNTSDGGSELLAELSEGGTLAVSSAGIGGGAIDNTTCTTSGDPTANILIDCDKFPPNVPGPTDETPIVVDPADPNHLLAGSNDYHLSFVGATVAARVPTGFYVSSDGGTTWTHGQIPMGNGASGGNGDPSPVFDRKFGTAHMAQLSGGCGVLCGFIDVSVSNSSDGGFTWSNPVTVAHGQAAITPAAHAKFEDKEWLTADNYPDSPHYGRLYLTWTGFGLSGGAYLESPVMMAYSDNAGRTWSRPMEISGSSAALCTYQETGPANQCDEDQFSVPVVLPDLDGVGPGKAGTVVVHFINEQNSSLWESASEFDDQILTVRSTDGGATWSDPVFAASLEDGARDYPVNVDGRLTQTGHQFRTQSAQGMSVDELTGDLYIFYADNRDGTHDPAAGITPVTKTNVFLAKSTDGGVSWGSPIRVTTGEGDRWFPWADARGGVVKVMYMDGSYDLPNRDQYGITLSTSTNGAATWGAAQQVSTALSDPDHSVWFRAKTADCYSCATFIGDYNGLTIDSLNRTHMVWTDMRRTVTVPQLSRTNKTEDVGYARR